MLYTLVVTLSLLGGEQRVYEFRFDTYKTCEWHRVRDDVWWNRNKNATAVCQFAL